jgi:hypothetical protein
LHPLESAALSRRTPIADAAEATDAKARAPAVYVDGAPLDDVTYLEAKLILNPERFTSAKALRDFGKVVSKTATAMNVGLTQSLDYYLSPKIREIVFADTPDFALYGAGFIFRRRIRVSLSATRSSCSSSVTPNSSERPRSTCVSKPRASTGSSSRRSCCR